MRVLDLFSGIGGFSLGLERAGMKTVAFCEIEEFPRRVLAKHWPHVPIFHDVRTLSGANVGAVDVICGGYPCQPFSLAGKRGGAEDDRHLWPEMRRLVDELRPAWVIGENVAGHISMGLDDVLSDLASLGYAARAFVIPAVGVGAPHRRDRLWIVAHTGGEQHEGRRAAFKRSGAAKLSQAALADAARVQPGRQDQRTLGERVREGGEPFAMADTAIFGRPGSGQPVHACDPKTEGPREATEPFDGGPSDQWLTEPDVGRVAHGVPSRVDRLRGLGNAVIPQIPEIIGRAIMATHPTGN